MAVERIELPSLSLEQTTPVSTAPALQGNASRNEKEENRSRRRLPVPETDSADPNVEDYSVENDDRPQHRIDRLA